MKAVDKAPSEFKQGWPAVLAAMIGIGLGLSPLPFYTIGMMAPELVKAFGWGFGVIQGGLLVSTAMVVLGAPLIGRITDKLGVERVALLSTGLFGLAFMAFALGNGNIVLFYLTWAAVGLSGLGTLPVTWTRLINARFDRSRGLALGLSLVGTGVFGFLVKPSAAWLIQHEGWRLTYIVIGALPLVIALPVAGASLLFLRKTDARAAVQAKTVGARSTPPPGVPIAEALRDWRFWLIVLAFLPLAFAVSGTIANMENVLKTASFHRSSIISMVQMIGLSVVFGRLLGGWLMDRVWAPLVACLTFIGAAVACWTLSQGSISYPEAFGAVVMVGLSAGAEFDVMAFLAARYFGLKSYAAIYGFLYAAFSIGAGLGPLAFGMAFDHWHDYSQMLSGAAIMFTVGGLLLLGLGRYRHIPRADAEESQAFALERTPPAAVGTRLDVVEVAP